MKSAAETGSLGIFVDSKGITEEDKQRLSAYRLLAREIGLQVGQYQFNPDTHIATAPISPIKK